MTSTTELVSASIGLVGVGRMGQGLAANMVSHGQPVVVYDRDIERSERFVAEHHADSGSASLQAARTAHELIARTTPPRAVILLVPAGDPVDDAITTLTAAGLDPGDIVVDAGNSHHLDTERRGVALQRHGIRLLGLGVSGGENGARYGPSLMAGGDRSAYADLEPLLTTIAAEAAGRPCCAHLGPGGTGHYVKMVHNGIEYALMALLGECYDALRHLDGMDPDGIADVFAAWNRGPLASFLLEISSVVLATADDRGSDAALIDRIADRAAQKGTGRHTAIDALDAGSPATMIAEAVLHRSLSAATEQRTAVLGRWQSRSTGETTPSGPLAGDLAGALGGAQLTAFAQGFALMDAARHHHHYEIDLAEVAAIWRGGCIIRAAVLDHIVAALADGPVANLLAAESVAGQVTAALPAWRRAVGAAVGAGLPAPVLSAALAYVDALRRDRLPTALVQAQRDFFGAHGYERTDGPGSFHTDWPIIN